MNIAMPLYNDENGIKQPQDKKENLRAELKLWERAFEKENGHKPTPADIKANSEISAKYKLYHKAFRPKTSSKSEKSATKTEYVSTAKALKQITPQKRPRDYDDLLTPVKSAKVGDAAETVGPTPQLNGRILGLFDGIQDQTPLTKRMKSNWGEQLAEARKDSPRKSTPRKRVLNEFIEPEYVQIMHS
jgi:DNA replication and checkpoint protein